jgi:hypothetical protein
METRIARIISIVFHPILIPTCFIAVIIHLNAFFALMIPEEAKWKIIVLVMITSAIFPLMVIYGMYRFRIISSLQMEKREERLYPYLVSAIFLSLSTYMIWQINISPVYYYVLLGASLLSIATLLINLYWKISAHTVAIGGVLGILIALQSVLMIDLLWLIVISLLIGGLVGFARLKTGSHTQSQVYAGYLLGFLTTLLLVLYY